MHRGSCLCGAVTFEVTGDLLNPGACHCRQCRKQSGHFFAAAEVPRAHLAIRGAESLTWYQASEKARRGFCTSCGSFLFWEALTGGVIEVALGAFDTATGTHLAAHIFMAEKGDYYDVNDGVEQFDRLPISSSQGTG
jgi:hypothetical protein